MAHPRILGCFAAILVIGTAATAASAQSDNYSSAPLPAPSARNQSNDDVECRQQAASETGYTGSSRADSDLRQRYAAAYYGCMQASNGGPPPNQYAYEPTPPPPYYEPDPYAYADPYPYPYPYYPYGGPVVSFGFGFGGRGHWR